MEIKQLAWFVVKRIVALAIVLILIATVNFVLFRAIPEDGIIPKTNNQVLIDLITQEYHLDRSLTEQYLWYMLNTLTLDFGISPTYARGMDISEFIGPSLERSLWLFAIVGSLTVFAGVVYEAVASILRTRVLRMTMRLVALGFLSVPALGAAMLAIYINGRLGWILPGGSPPYNPLIHGDGDIWHRMFYDISHGILPVAICILLTFGFVPLFFRRQVGEPSSLRGLWRGGVGILGTMRDNPWLTKLFFAWIVGCLLVVDIVFWYHGLGTLLWEGLGYVDLPIVMASFLVIASILAVANCVFDITAAVFPRRAQLPPSENDSAESDTVMQAPSRESPPITSSLNNVWTSYRKSKAGMAALIVFVAMALLALAAPLLATVDPNDPQFFETSVPPDWRNPLPPSFDPSPYTGYRHLLGTDQRGMDIYSAMLYGSRDLVFACVSIGMLSLALGITSGLVGARLPANKSILTGGLGWLVGVVGDTFVAIPLILMIVGLLFVNALNGRQWDLWFVSLLVAPLVFLWASVSIAQHVRERAMSSDVAGGGPSSIRSLLPTITARALHITKLSIVIGLLTLIAIDLFAGVFEISGWGALLEVAYERNAAVGEAWWWFLPPVLGTCLLILSAVVIVDTLERIVNKKENATRATGAPSQSVTTV